MTTTSTKTITAKKTTTTTTTTTIASASSAAWTCLGCEAAVLLCTGRPARSGASRRWQTARGLLRNLFLSNARDMRSVAARFSVSGDKVPTLNPKILDDGSVYCSFIVHLRRWWNPCTRRPAPRYQASALQACLSNSSRCQTAFSHTWRRTPPERIQSVRRSATRKPRSRYGQRQPQEVAAPQTSPSCIAEFAKLDMTGSQAAVCWFHSPKCGLTLPRTS